MEMKDNIKKLRKERNLTLDALAKKSGVSKPYLWQLENEDKKPSADILLKIANALDTSIAVLMSLPVTVKKKTLEGLPESLKNFLKKAVQLELDLTQEDIEMLAGINYRGEPPKTTEDWIAIYQSIKKSV